MPENNDDLRPSWVPEEKNPEFACSVMRGIDTTANSITGAKEYPDAPLRKVPLRKKMTVEQYIDGVAKGDRVTLSKAITLIESNAPKDFDKAQLSCANLKRSRRNRAFSRAVVSVRSLTG